MPEMALPRALTGLAASTLRPLPAPDDLLAAMHDARLELQAARMRACAGLEHLGRLRLEVWRREMAAFTPLRPRFGSGAPTHAIPGIIDPAARMAEIMTALDAALPLGDDAGVQIAARGLAGGGGATLAWLTGERSPAGGASPPAVLGHILGGHVPRVVSRGLPPGLDGTGLGLPPGPARRLVDAVRLITVTLRDIAHVAHLVTEAIHEFRPQVATARETLADALSSRRPRRRRGWRAWLSARLTPAATSVAFRLTDYPWDEALAIAQASDDAVIMAGLLSCPLLTAEGAFAPEAASAWRRLALRAATETPVESED